MKSGPPPIPTQLKLLRGNPGKQVDDRGLVGGDAVKITHQNLFRVLRARRLVVGCGNLALAIHKPTRLCPHTVDRDLLSSLAVPA
jgi:hypothetical protein